MVFKEVVLDFCWSIWWHVPDFSPKLLWTSGCCPLSTFLISSWRLILPLLSQAWCQKEKTKTKTKSQIACVLLQSSGESTPLCRGKHLQSWSIFWLRSSRHLYRVLQTWGNKEGKARLGEGSWPIASSLYHPCHHPQAEVHICKMSSVWACTCGCHFDSFEHRHMPHTRFMVELDVTQTFNHLSNRLPQRLFWNAIPSRHSSNFLP